MYDVSELRSQNKKTVVAVLIVALLAGTFCAGYLFGLRNAGSDTDSVPDNRAGIDNVRNELSTAQVNQRELTEGIAGAEAGAARIEAGIRHVAESVAATEAAVRDAAELIDQCQQILGRVRNRGKAGASAH